MNLPEKLMGFEAELKKALEVEVPDDCETLQQADQPTAIGQVLIARLPEHAHLGGARVVYLFKKDMKAKGKITLAHVKPTGAEVEYLAEYDFIMTVNHTAWLQLTQEQRLALIDHELCHCGLTDSGKWGSISHDVEEFRDIIDRWGLWKPDLAEFGKSVLQAAESA